MITDQVPQISRRRLLQMLGLSTGALGASSLLAGCFSDSDPAAAAPASKQAVGAKQTKSSGRAAPKAKANDHILVVIELKGGNDGFATLVPYGDGKFRKLRDRIWLADDQMVKLDDKYAVPKGLGVVAERLAFVEAVGVAKPDLSHFTMMQRWWQSDPDGTSNYSTGFLGRCCDELRGDEAITGVSMGYGSTQALVTASASTVSLPQVDLVSQLAKDEPLEKRLRTSLQMYPTIEKGRSLGIGEEPDRLIELARANMGDGLGLLKNITKLGERPKRYPDTELSRSLALTRQLISLNVGMKVFHVPWGSFDTHDNQPGAHSELMNEFGNALAAFLDDLADNGLADRVLVATTSEFGRRPEANGQGTDHGTASTMMLAGAVNPGRYGTSPDFGKRNEDGNVAATTSMTDYYATLGTGWLGAPVDETAGKGSTVIDGLLRV